MAAIATVKQPGAGASHDEWAAYINNVSDLNKARNPGSDSKQGFYGVMEGQPGFDDAKAQWTEDQIGFGMAAANKSAPSPAPPPISGSAGGPGVSGGAGGPAMASPSMSALSQAAAPNAGEVATSAPGALRSNIGSRQPPQFSGSLAALLQRSPY